jgi:hypothetical protein
MKKLAEIFWAVTLAAVFIAAPSSRVGLLVRTTTQRERGFVE